MNIESYASPFNQVHYFAFFDAYYGSGSGPYHLDDVQCWGSEVSLLSYSHAVVGVHNCKHGDEDGVKCVGKLVGLNSWNQGVTIVLC